MVVRGPLSVLSLVMKVRMMKMMYGLDLLLRIAGDGNFHPGYLLLDPYATRAVPVVLPEAYYNTAPHLPPYLEMDKPVMMGSLSALSEEPFDWGGGQRAARERTSSSAGGFPVRASLKDEDAVLFNLDVASFTQVGPWPFCFSLVCDTCI